MWGALRFLQYGLHLLKFFCLPFCYLTSNVDDGRDEGENGRDAWSLNLTLYKETLIPCTHSLSLLFNGFYWFSAKIDIPFGWGSWVTICRVSEIWHAWRPLACEITKTCYFSMVVSRPAPTHEKRSGKMPSSCLLTNLFVWRLLLVKAQVEGYWSQTRAGISKYVENVICSFSNMSLPFRYLLCDSLLPWQPLSLCALYSATDKERRDPPTLLTQSAWRGEAVYDLGCMASQPVLTHLSVVVHALLI